MTHLQGRRRSGMRHGSANGPKRLLALGAAALAMSPAAAQRSAGDDNTFAPASTSIAAVPGRGYRIGVSLTTLFDDNILRINDARVPLRPGDRKADFRISPAVDAAYSLPVGRQQLFIGGLIGRDIYARNSDKNRNRYVLGGGLNWRVGQACVGAVSAEYQRRQSLLSDLSEFTDNVQETKIYTATADCTPPVGIGFGGTVRRIETDNDSTSRIGFNSRNTSYSPRLNFRSATLGTLTLGGTYTDITYPDRTVLDANGSSQGDGLHIYSGQVGFSRALGTRMNFSLSGSYIKASPQPGVVQQPFLFAGIPICCMVSTRQGFSGAGYNGSLSYHPGRRLTATLSASRDANSSSNVGALFVINNIYGADFGYMIGPSLTAGIGGSYAKRDYRNSFSSATEIVPRISDANTRVYARVTYSPVKLYDIDFEVGHQSRSSNPSIYNYKSNSATLSLRVKFGRS